MPMKCQIKICRISSYLNTILIMVISLEFFLFHIVNAQIQTVKKPPVTRVDAVRALRAQYFYRPGSGAGDPSGQQEDL